MYTCCVLLMLLCLTTRLPVAPGTSLGSTTSHDCWQKSATPVSCTEQINSHILLPHPEDCQLFYHCLRPDLPPVCRKCPYDQHFDPVKLVCTLPSEAGCELLIDTTLNNTTISSKYNYHNKGTVVFQLKHKLSLVNETLNDENVLKLDGSRRSERSINIKMRISWLSRDTLANEGYDDFDLQSRDVSLSDGSIPVEDAPEYPDYPDYHDALYSDGVPIENPYAPSVNKSIIDILAEQEEDSDDSDHWWNYSLGEYHYCFDEEPELDSDSEVFEQHPVNLHDDYADYHDVKFAEEYINLTHYFIDNLNKSLYVKFFKRLYLEEGEEFTKDPFLLGSAKTYGSGTFFMKVYEFDSKYDVQNKSSPRHKTRLTPTTGGVRVVRLDVSCFLHFINTSRVVPLKRYFIPLYTNDEDCRLADWTGPDPCDNYCYDNLRSCYEIGYIYTGKYNHRGFMSTKGPDCRFLRVIPLYYIRKTEPLSKPIKLVDPTTKWAFNITRKGVHSRGIGPRFAPVTVLDVSMLRIPLFDHRRRYTIIKKVPYYVIGPVIKLIHMKNVHIINEKDFDLWFNSVGDSGPAHTADNTMDAWRGNIEKYAEELISALQDVQHKLTAMITDLFKIFRS